MAKELYGLYDDDDQLKYLGIADNALRRRDAHWYDRTKRRTWNAPLSRWLRGLKRRPQVRVLAIVEDDAADRMEANAISRFRQGHPGQLLNVWPKPSPSQPVDLSMFRRVMARSFDPEAHRAVFRRMWAEVASGEREMVNGNIGKLKGSA